MTFWSRSLDHVVLSRDKLNLLHLYYRNVSGYQTRHDNNLPFLWSRSLTRSRDKIKPLYLHNQRAYYNQTWQSGNLPWLDSVKKSHHPLMTCLMRSRDKLKALHLHFRSAYDRQTWQDGNLPYLASDHKVTWPFYQVAFKITWQTKMIIFSLPQCLWSPDFGSSWP